MTRSIPLPHNPGGGGFSDSTVSAYRLITSPTDRSPWMATDQEAPLGRRRRQHELTMKYAKSWLQSLSDKRP